MATVYPQNLISSRSSWGKHPLKFGENLCMGLGCGTHTIFMPKVLSGQQLLPDTPKTLISSRSYLAKDTLKIW